MMLNWKGAIYMIIKVKICIYIKEHKFSFRYDRYSQVFIKHAFFFVLLTLNTKASYVSLSGASSILNQNESKDKVCRNHINV